MYCKEDKRREWLLGELCDVIILDLMMARCAEVHLKKKKKSAKGVWGGSNVS